MSPSRQRLFSLAAFQLIALPPFLCTANEQLGLQLPPGFDVTLFADDDLASDIYSMTLDSFGRVVVSGRGYVRILVDTDRDGAADEAIQLVDGPETGAQGMAFDGRDLLCTGDQGLLRYVDRDGDDRADGPAEVLLEASAGGEHHIHAIRKGPNGSWYLIAGNMAGIDQRYTTLASSPIKKPRAGTLLRLTPDLTKSEVIAEGFRNAYDFDFHPSGDIFTYDSDGERDVSLPWYRPTRVFQVLPGSHAGWFSRHWKRPAGFLDMPPVIAPFGRGSPTGVVCYRHTQFPEKYRDALFVFDWTYGRVLALPLAADGSVWQSEPEEFISAVGQFGFAPTDAAVAPEGSLFVSVGGRGTRGGVYRIRWKAAETSVESANVLTKCLSPPQPLSSWSRHEWEPIAKRLGAEKIRKAAIDSRFSVSQRIRAIEILTEKFDGLDADAAQKILQSDSATLRARLAWSLAHSPSKPHHQASLDSLLQDESPLVARQSLEALVGQPAIAIDPHATAISKLLASDDPFVRQTATRLAASASEAIHSPTTGNSADAWIGTLRIDGHSPASVDIALKILVSEQPIEAKRDAARALQIALGDVGPAPGVVPVFEGYTCQVDLKQHVDTANSAITSITKIYPSDDSQLNHELVRLIAMLQPTDPRLLDRLLSQITETSDAVDDIHHLIALARLPASRTTDQRQHIAKAVTELEQKIVSARQNRDSNWDDRILEMVTAQIQLDPLLPAAILSQPALGDPGQVPLIQSLTGDQLQQAIDKFVARIHVDSDYRWTSEVAQLLGKSKRPDVRALLRAQAEDFSVRSIILTILAARPENQDRSLFVAGLENHDIGVLSDMARALESLPADANPAEQVALVRTLRRLAPTREERTIQDSLIQMLRNNTGQSFGYKLKLPPSNRQTSAIAKWTTWAEDKFPTEWTNQTGSTNQDADQLKKMLDGVDWTVGDAAKGESLFHKRSCTQCHGGSRSLGPDLAGVAGRFSRSDLFVAITMPNRDVSPRYQTTLITIDDGRVHTGRVIYGSVDGLVLRTGANETLRIETENITEQRRLSTSLMPAGLLNDLQPSDMADLYAYLRTLDGKSE